MYNESIILTTTQFVTSIVTVWNAIAFVSFLHALFQIRTLELIWLTSYWGAILLVLFVKTVVVTVANPILWNAMTGSRTSELVVGACFLCTEITFVCAVTAVILRVAFPRQRNTPTIAAVESSTAASNVYTSGFVAEVAAVVF